MFVHDVKMRACEVVLISWSKTVQRKH